MFFYQPSWLANGSSTGTKASAKPPCFCNIANGSLASAALVPMNSGVAVNGAVLVDRPLQFGHAPENAAANPLFGEAPEQAFDQLDPRPRDRGEVRMKRLMMVTSASG